jgi:hypothetical protein
MLANVRGLRLGQNRTKQTNNPYVDRSPPGSRSGLAIAAVHQGVSSFLDRSLLRTRESRHLYPRTTESRCSYPRTTHSGDLGRRCGWNYGTTADGRGTAVWGGRHRHRGDSSSAWTQSRTAGDGLEILSSSFRLYILSVL